MSEHYLPAGAQSVTPYLVVPDGNRLMDFMKQVFGAKELFRMNGKDGQIAHAEVQIGDSKIMLGTGGQGHPPLQAMLHVYVPDADETYKKALAQGATSEREPEHQFYGDRNAGFRDNSGTLWYVATHLRDVPMEELAAAQ